MDHRAFFSLPEWAKKKITSASTRQQAVSRPDRDLRVQGASREARARSAVPPSVAFEQPQTADGKPPSGQGAAGQTQTQLDQRRCVERHPELSRPRSRSLSCSSSRRSSLRTARGKETAAPPLLRFRCCTSPRLSSLLLASLAPSITLRARRRRRAARHTSPPSRMRFVGRWRHTSTKEAAARTSTHHARCAHGNSE